MESYHIDVFSKKPFEGNGLTVVFHDYGDIRHFHRIYASN